MADGDDNNPQNETLQSSILAFPGTEGPQILEEDMELVKGQEPQTQEALSENSETVNPVVLQSLNVIGEMSPIFQRGEYGSLEIGSQQASEGLAQLADSVDGLGESQRLQNVVLSPLTNELVPAQQMMRLGDPDRETLSRVNTQQVVSLTNPNATDQPFEKEATTIRVVRGVPGTQNSQPVTSEPRKPQDGAVEKPEDKTDEESLLAQAEQHEKKEQEKEEAAAQAGPESPQPRNVFEAAAFAAVTASIGVIELAIRGLAGAAFRLGKDAWNAVKTDSNVQMRDASAESEPSRDWRQKKEEFEDRVVNDKKDGLTVQNKDTGNEVPLAEGISLVSGEPVSANINGAPIIDYAEGDVTPIGNSVPPMIGDTNETLNATAVMANVGGTSGLAERVKQRGNQNADQVSQIDNKIEQARATLKHDVDSIAQVVGVGAGHSRDDVRQALNGMSDERRETLHARVADLENDADRLAEGFEQMPLDSLENEDQEGVMDRIKSLFSREDKDSPMNEHKTLLDEMEEQGLMGNVKDVVKGISDFIQTLKDAMAGMLGYRQQALESFQEAEEGQAPSPG